MKENSWEWTEDDLLKLIELKIQEGIELDYKQSESLQKSDKKKDEISKDVSAFANAAGGVIIYGIKEDKHYPVSIDNGSDPFEISKEWLEQIINSKIQRRIDGIRINQVQLSKSSPGRVAYVVYIPQSNMAPHQAADKRFYKRFNFESVPMEEYEVRDTSHRKTFPDIEIKLLMNGKETPAKLKYLGGEFYEPINLSFSIHNNSSEIAECAVIHINIDRYIDVSSVPNDVTVSSEDEIIKTDEVSIHLQKLTIIWDRSKNMPLYKGITAVLPSKPLSLSLPVDGSAFVIQYCVSAPNMQTKIDTFSICVKDEYAEIKEIHRARA